MFYSSLHFADDNDAFYNVSTYSHANKIETFFISLQATYSPPNAIYQFWGKQNYLDVDVAYSLGGEDDLREVMICEIAIIFLNFFLLKIKIMFLLKQVECAYPFIFSNSQSVFYRATQNIEIGDKIHLVVDLLQ